MVFFAAAWLRSSLCSQNPRQRADALLRPVGGTDFSGPAGISIFSRG